MTRRNKNLIIGLFTAVILVILVWFLVLKRGPEEERKAGTTAPAAQVGTVNLSPEMQRNGGIVTANPKPFSYREETQAYVSVVDPGGLIDLRKNYLAAEAGAAKTKAALASTGPEYERMKTLYAEKNVSAKA